MQERELVVGFSELKDLLIQTYGIDRDRVLIKLYFSQAENELLMHDYDDHKKIIVLSANLAGKKLRPSLTGKARLIIEESLKYSMPTEFLNRGFKLYGFFKF